MLVIGITGTLGAGKGTVVEYLINQKKFKHYSVGDYLTEQLQKQKRKVDRDGMREIANEIRTKYGPDHITKILFERANKMNENSIIESIRNPKEVEFIKAHGGYIFAVIADQKLRYKRIKSRGSSKDGVTFKEFKLQENKESKTTNQNAQNLPKCISMADFKIENNGTINNLNKKVEAVIEKINVANSKTEKHSRPSWDDYFTEIMKAVSTRGTCDRGRAACVFVKDKQILVTGYAGSPIGFPHCDEVGHDLRKSFNEDGTISQHCVRTVHAEQNALCQAARKGVSLDGATVYVNMTPCRTCAMLLINSGIKRVYAERKYHTGKESEKMFNKAGIKIQYKFNEVQEYSNQKG